MFLNLYFLGKDDLTKEDKVSFKFKKNKIVFEVFCQHEVYNFSIKKGKKTLKNFSIDNKKLGNNTSTIEIKSFFYNQEIGKQEIVLNLGYNGSNSLILIDAEKMIIYLLNPIGDEVDTYTLFFYEFED